ncbi:MAG: cob(I)yrinic acid a,c-diamide adenosyltransferase [Anaerolineae bacterium]
MNDTVFYTGRGDRGDTARLKGEKRVAKSSALIDVIGTVDEATSAIGVARAAAQTETLQRALPTAQRHLYRLMSHLSATPETRGDYPGLSEDEVNWLEALIAELEVNLPPLRDFVLPGDSVAGAAFHMARAVVRRAERRLVAFAETEAHVGEANLAYMNRLSSLMFVAALHEDMLAGKDPQLARGS